MTIEEIEDYFVKSAGYGKDKIRNFMDIVDKALEEKNKRIDELKEENKQLKKTAIVWHKQDVDDIYDTINDWSLHKYLCKMNDGSLNIATGGAVEGGNGDVSRSIYFKINDEKYYSDDIEVWTEITEV